MCDQCECSKSASSWYLVLKHDSHGEFYVYSLCEDKDKAMEHASTIVNCGLADKACVVRVSPRIDVFECTMSRDTCHINEQLERFKA